MPDFMDVTITVQDACPDRAPLTRDDIPPPSCYRKRSEWRRDVHALLLPEVLAAAQSELDRHLRLAVPRGLDLIRLTTNRVIDRLGLADSFVVLVSFIHETRYCDCVITLTSFEIDTYGPQDSLAQPPLVAIGQRRSTINGRDPFVQEMQGEWHD